MREHDPTSTSPDDTEQSADGAELLALLKGRAHVRRDLTVHLSERDGAGLQAKMRQAYWWIINNAIICPYYDIEYGVQSKVENSAGDRIGLHDAMSYSSYVLIPMLTLFTCRRALLVGGPGRGKTTSAVLMALQAGMSQEDVRRSILRGHPQLTIADMLGTPLPADMMRAEEASDIRIGWRGWIGERVKIIDEYNRIPTKTQSALLSLMAEGYAEMFEQYVYTGRSSWFLTANDDAGGGTFKVIDALKDRIDVVVRAVPFHSGYIHALLERIESDSNPQDAIPTEIIFTEAELQAIYEAILTVTIPPEVLDRVAFFLGQLDFCRRASPHFEFKNKDTLKLAGRTVASVCNENCPLDKKVHLCTQTENGVSARTYQTCIHFAKALAYFRGHTTVELEDFRQILPWVLHEKLAPNIRSPFFQVKGNDTLLQDRVAWIRTMFDTGMSQYARHQPEREHVRAEQDRVDTGLAGVTLETATERLEALSSHIQNLFTQSELSGPTYENLIQLKALYSRYSNYIQWLKRTETPG